ncbi:ring-cleaving dioxygenase, partial [Listeria monocytogenes]
ILLTFFGFSIVTEDDGLHLYDVGVGGIGALVIVEERTDIPAAMLGFGGVHHVAFRVVDHEELLKWIDRLNTIEAPNT